MTSQVVIRSGEPVPGAVRGTPTLLFGFLLYREIREGRLQDECAWGSSFQLEARSGRTYEAYGFDRREPALFACADYHRPTTDAGWLTFEIRDADAKGLLLLACLPWFSGCEAPAVIRIS